MIYIGDNQPTIYLGDNEPVIYLGDNQVYPMGPFVGIRLTRSLTFAKSGGTLDLKVKSSDNWEILGVPAWLTLSSTAGTSGDTTISATAQDNQTGGALSATLTAYTTNSAYSATCEVVQKYVPTDGYLSINGYANFVTAFNPYVEYNKNRYIRLELNYAYKNRGNYMFQVFHGAPWFTYEYSIYGENPYFNFGNTGVLDGIISTSGYDTTLIVTFDQGNASSNLGQTNTFNKTLPNDVMHICGSAANAIQLDFYNMKIYNSPTNLIYDFQAATDGTDAYIYEAVNNTRINKSGSGSVSFVHF